MPYEEITVALDGGYQAYARYYPADDPCGAVLYHHGIQSHCGWYERSAEALRAAGYHVLQLDRRGSGKNHEQRGHAESADQLLADSRLARDELLRRSGFDAYHLVGVSWGGKWVVAAHVDDDAGVKSLTLVTPGLFPLVGVSSQEKAKIGFAMLYEQNKLFDIPLNDADLFTKVDKWKRFFESDEDTLRQCSAAFYLASRRMDKTCAKLAKARPVPVHLLVAGEERIVDNAQTIEFIEGLGWKGTRVTRYAAARHSLEFDVPEAYFRDLVQFLRDVDA